MDDGNVSASYSPSALDVPPSRLFKYRSLAGEGLTLLRSIVHDHVLWWGSPNSFNDPFDCFPAIDTSGSVEEKIAWSKRAAARHHIGASRRDRRAFVSDTARRKLRRGLGSNPANAGGRQAWRDTLAKMGVCCLTSRCDHMLMWGHYADSHRGVCLEFDTAAKPFALAHRVAYGDDRPVFRPLQADRTGLMERVLLRKASAWAYEEEWRIFAGGKVGLTPFPTSALTAIILGAQISDEHEEAVRGMIAMRKTIVEIKKAKLDDRQYKLVITPGVRQGRAAEAPPPTV